MPLAFLAVVSCPTEARGQELVDPDDPTPHSEARLAVETTSARPGTSLSVGLVIMLDPGWHTYWRNPGDSGSEAILEWTLPPGLTAGPVQWPRPERVPYPPLMSYAYHGQVMLLTDVAVGEGVPPGSVARLQVRASWLACQEICLPAEDTLVAEIPVLDVPPTPDPGLRDEFAATRALLPLEAPGWQARAIETPAGYTLELRSPPGWSARPADLYFFPADPTAVDHVEPQEPAWDGDVLRLQLLRSAYNTGPAALEGVLVRSDGGGFDAGGSRPALAVTAPVAAAASLDGLSSPVTGGTVPGTLLVALALAFAGGLLLNLMPCVFPVLSLKIMGFVRHAGGDPGRTRRHALAFAAGVVLSFLALAGALLAVRAAGAQVGWGFQLQSPPIVAFLCALLFVLGLVMIGVVEPGLSLTRLGSVGAGEERYPDSFLTGVLAAAVATPCTAPFMGAAVGAALVRPAAEGLAIFAALGAGMATPYVVLSSWPALLERIPRPGPWMETLKQALAFPMFAVSVWLVWVFGLQTGVGGAAALLGALTAVAFGCWVLGRWPASTTHGRARAATRAVALIAFLAAAGAAWRASRTEPVAFAAPDVAAGAPPAAGADGEAVPRWETFGDGSAIPAHRRAGRAVFVDFTAAWCISCQVNERVVLSSRRVVDAFRERGVALVKADWTRRDPQITRALASFGRSGVPLYVLSPADPETEPELLPAVLTYGIVLEALERATAAAPAARPAG